MRDAHNSYLKKKKNENRLLFSRLRGPLAAFGVLPEILFLFKKSECLVLLYKAQYGGGGLDSLVGPLSRYWLDLTLPNSNGGVLWESGCPV
jgi:hypothetical protein